MKLTHYIPETYSSTWNLLIVYTWNLLIVYTWNLLIVYLKPTHSLSETYSFSTWNLLIVYTWNLLIAYLKPTYCLPETYSFSTWNPLSTRNLLIVCLKLTTCTQFLLPGTHYNVPNSYKNLQNWKGILIISCTLTRKNLFLLWNITHLILVYQAQVHWILWI